MNNLQALMVQQMITNLEVGRIASDNLDEVYVKIAQTLKYYQSDTQCMVHLEPS